MFTGIIEAVGTIRSAAPDRDNKVFEITSPFSPKPGESLAVDGVCLTVKEVRAGGFLADAVAETVALTTLKHRRQGDSVNLERALLPTDRMGGHIVSGHIDETGKVLNIRTLPGSHRFEFGVSPEGSRLVVNKGSIAIDGISLTVAEVKGQRVFVSIIPFTVQNTTLKLRRVGDEVNIEFDVIGKYVARLLPRRSSEL
jgi:riboflavin synthase